MATAKTKFTQEQIDNLSGVAKKYGGFENTNFQNAVNTKYGAGSYDSLNSSLSSINEAQKAKKAGMGGTNQQGQVDMQTPANAQSFSASVTPVAANIGGTMPNTPQQQQPEAKTNLNPPKTVVQTAQATVAPPVVEKTTTITPEGETIVKKETPAPAVVDFNVGAGREQEILTNLNDGAANAPELFQNQDTFRTAYGYATADDTKKRMLDAFFQAKAAQQNNPDALFQQIVNNQTIQNPEIRNSPAFKSAQTRASDLNVNSGLSAKELSDQIKNGSINIGSQAYKDLQATNPQLVQDAERINTLNTGIGGKTDTNAIEANVGNNIIKDVPKQDVPNLQKMLSENEQVADSLAKSKETKAKVDSIQDGLDNMEEDIRAQYKGTGATEGYIQALISEKSKPLIRQLNTLNRTYSNQLAELQFYSDIVKSDYADQKAQRADERNFQQQKEIATFQNALATESKKLDYAYQNSRDVQNFKQDLQKMGITDALQINRDKLNFDQQKEFAAIQNKYQNSRDVQNYAQDINKLAFQYNNDPSNVSKNIENMKAMPVSPLAPQLLSIPDGESVPNTRSQCGQYVNDVLGTPGLFKDSIEDKIKATNSKEPQIGGAVVLSSTGKFSPYGHVGIVVGMDDKTITVKSSNRDGDGKISTDVLDRNYSRIKGYYNPKSANGQRKYTDPDMALLGAVDKLDVQGKKTLEENGFTTQDWANFKDGLLPPTESQRKETQGVLDLVSQLSKHDGLSDAVGFKGLQTGYTVPGSDKADFEALFQTLVDKLASANLDKIKGAMSDKDIEFLRNIEKNGLSYDSSEEQFKKQLKSLQEKYTNVLNRGNSAVSKIQPQVQNSKDVDAILNEWNTRNQ